MYITCIILFFLLFTLSRNKLIIFKAENLRYGIHCALFFCFILLYIIHGFRYLNYIGSDEYYYRMIPQHARDFLSSELINESLRSLSLNLSNWVFFRNGQFYVLATSIIWLMIMLKCMKDYSVDVQLSLFILISGDFLASMNIIRQSVAAAIVFYAYRYLIKSDTWKYVLIILVFACGFHSTSLIMIPMYFLLRQKNFINGIFLFAIPIIIFSSNFVNIGYYFLSDTHYVNYFTTYSVKGANNIRVTFYVIPAIITLLLSKKLNMNYINRNIIFVYIIVCLLSLKNLYFMRFNAFITPVVICEYAKIPYCFHGKNRQYVKYGMYLCFFICGIVHYIMPPERYHNVLFESIKGSMEYHKM